MTRKPAVSGNMPTIIINEVEHDHLTVLAERAVSSAPDAASILRAEMRRATVVPVDKVPISVIRMGSRVEFSFDGAQPRDVELVYPAWANISEGRISVLTPIGAALIGLAKGQSFTWKTNDSRLHKLTVLRVAPPDPEPAMKHGSEVNVVNFLPRSRNLSSNVPDDPDGDDHEPRAA
jgi:regulator of nucleoside diphosphate kinase